MWVDIAAVVAEVMGRFTVGNPRTVDDVLAADARGRQLASDILAKRHS